MGSSQNTHYHGDQVAGAQKQSFSLEVPPGPKPQLQEEDKFPVCHQVLPPKGPDGSEAEREAHVESCIATQFSPAPRSPYPSRPKSKTRVSQRIQIEAASKGKSEETEARLGGARKVAATPLDRPTKRKLPLSHCAATSLRKTSNINRMPEDTDSVLDYKSNKYFEDETKDSIDTRKPSSVMGPPKLPASATREKNQQPLKRSSSSSMGPPGLPASATRGKRHKIVGQGAGTENLGKGKRSWSMDDLPTERYTMDGRKIR